LKKVLIFVTIASDLRALSAGAKATVDKMKGSLSKKDSDATY
jgi:4-hydroxy-2-oxoheptanedioate aldolase